MIFNFHINLEFRLNYSTEKMDEVEDLFEKGEGNGINFIPCVKWVQRGVAKSEPEKVRTKKIKVNQMFSRIF